MVFFRTADIIQAGLEQLQTYKQQYPNIRLDDKDTLWNTEIIEALELRNLMVVGEVIMTGALQRKESRGAHSREDFPTRNDDQFLQHTLAYFSTAGIELKYMPVNLNQFEPQERKY